MVDIQPGSVASASDALTEREREILVCLAEGLSNPEIASRLFLAEKTVRWYNSQIYSKLAVSRLSNAPGAHIAGAAASACGTGDVS